MIKGFGPQDFNENPTEIASYMKVVSNGVIYWGKHIEGIKRMYFYKPKRSVLKVHVLPFFGDYLAR
ncbi:MAG: hypothetical protein ACI8RD_011808 [Bacillariaceae sp.]|jgi:hypothetical protein